MATLCFAQKHEVLSLYYHTRSQTCLPSQLIPASAFFMAPLEQQVSELMKRVDELARSNAGAKITATVASQEHACAAAVRSSAPVTPLQSWRRVQVTCDHSRLAQLLIPMVPRDCMAWLRRLLPISKRCKLISKQYKPISKRCRRHSYPAIAFCRSRLLLSSRVNEAALAASAKTFISCVARPLVL